MFNTTKPPFPTLLALYLDYLWKMSCMNKEQTAFEQLILIATTWEYHECVLLLTLLLASYSGERYFWTSLISWGLVLYNGIKLS